jgi:hypothetical protein
MVVKRGMRERGVMLECLVNNEEGESAEGMGGGVVTT